jgi:murein DD-endopeptidase MepM/ murein hydrolase activator NlpD
MLVLGLAPLAVHRPLAEAQATSTPPYKTQVDDSALGIGSTAAQTRSLAPVAHRRVRKGETVQSVAARAGISVDTLLRVNQLTPTAQLSAGEQLIVPPVDGTMIRIDPKQSLDGLALTFGVDVESLRILNGLRRNGRLPVQLFIPTVENASADPAVALDGAAPSDGREHLIRFGWPAKGVLTQGFSGTHPGIDIANDVGTPEVAADDGKVVFAGWGDYGLFVQIDHGNGFTTVYGHLSVVMVSTGQTVAKGQQIGLMGATGRATGPHLHFEIRYQGVPQNPLDLLS